MIQVTSLIGDDFRDQLMQVVSDWISLAYGLVPHKFEGRQPTNRHDALVSLDLPRYEIYYLSVPQVDLFSNTFFQNILQRKTVSPPWH